jgi:hypothetical protein
MGIRVHQGGEPLLTIANLSDGPPIDLTDRDCFGSVSTVIRRLEELRAFGLHKVIGWFHFGNMPHESIRRSMQLIASHVLPRIS